MSDKQIADKEIDSGALSLKTVEGVRLEQIDRTDKSFQVRAGLNEAKLREYQKIAKETPRLQGFSSRPLLWLRKDGQYVTVDGVHRIEAAARAGVTEVDADVLEGSQRDALIKGVTANLNHGIELTAGEKREACLRVIEALSELHGCQPLNNWVAEVMRVSEGWIRLTRNKLVGEGRLDEPTEVVGKDGVRQAARKPVRTASKPRQTTPAARPANTALAAKAAPTKTTAEAMSVPAAPVPPSGKSRAATKDAASPVQSGSKAGCGAKSQASLQVGLVDNTPETEAVSDDSRIRALRDILPVVEGLVQNKAVLEPADRAEIEQIMHRLLEYMEQFLADDEGVEELRKAS